MKILLTGGTGMLGRNILEHPSAREFQIVAPTRIELDLRQKEHVHRFIKEEQPDLVIHAAALVGGIQANIDNPVDYLSTNIELGMNVLLGALKAGVPKAINVASSCMYPINANQPLNEETLASGELEPTNEGYAFAKLAVTKLCQYISASNPNLFYRTIVPCNLYGRFDKFTERNSHMLAAAIRKVHHAKKTGGNVKIWGDGSARREFMTASDCADFVFHYSGMLEKGPDIINVGLGYDFSITDYYQAVCQAMDYDAEFVFEKAKPVGVKQKLVCTKRLQSTGWKATKSLHEGLSEAISFYEGEVA